MDSNDRLWSGIEPEGDEWFQAFANDSPEPGRNRRYVVAASLLLIVVVAAAAIVMPRSEDSQLGLASDPETISVDEAAQQLCQIEHARRARLFNIHEESFDNLLDVDRSRNMPEAERLEDDKAEFRKLLDSFRAYADDWSGFNNHFVVDHAQGAAYREAIHRSIVTYLEKVYALNSQVDTLSLTMNQATFMSTMISHIEAIDGMKDMRLEDQSVFALDLHDELERERLRC